MKGLIFNLLDSMARQSGCADEAWDLVMEFVATETEQDGPSDTCLSTFGSLDTSLPSFQTPAEAMIQCLGSEGSGLGETLSEFPELSLLLDAEDYAGDSIPALADPDFCLPHVGPSPEGFSNDLLSLLEQLLAEALTGGDAETDDFEDEDCQLSPWDPSRRSGS